MLIAIIAGPTIEAALAEMEETASLADAFEIRFDHFEEDAFAHSKRLEDLVASSLLPLIFTFRKKDQGGHRAISEKDRFAAIEKLAALHPAYFDFEADVDPAFIAQIAKKFPKIKLIGSYHNFEETPRNLDAVLDGMKNPHFSVYKIAVKANSTPDMLKLMTFLKEQSPKISLCCISMGEYGKPSRVLGKVLGNALDYSAREEEQTLLHRYSLKTLREIFHYRELNCDTRIYSLIGDPVEQSPGHIFHNESFRKEHRNAVYIKMRILGEELGDLFAYLNMLPFSGLSVTIPLKEAVPHFLDQIDPAAKEIGAVNTISIKKGIKTGSNTDAPGALNAIEHHLKVKQKRIAILGAGGTARAIAYESMQRGATVSIFNRTPERAVELASEMGCAGFGMNELPNHTYDILINTTAPSPDGTAPIPAEQILSGSTVMDVVYYPKETPLLKLAKQRGCPCVYGEEMFREQALLQQRAWK